MTQTPRAEIVVDLAAIRHNVRRLREVVASGADPAPQLMTVVKADAYGHGTAPVARAARQAGADWLGVATPEEAVLLRDAGDTGPLMCWLAAPGDDYTPVLSRDVDVAASSLRQLADIADSAGRAGRPARVHLKIDTGLSRGGATAAEWPELVAAARREEEAGTLRVIGVWSHLACGDEPDHPANDEQEKAFLAAVEVAEREGLRPELRHLANSAGAMLRPSARFDLVRCGIASYGLDPAPGNNPGHGLRPAMTARARLSLVKRIEAGAGVSYGHTWVAEHETTVGLVPAGYGEGIPRRAGNHAEVAVGGRRRPIRGRVCMDQFTVDLGTDSPEPGADAILFGPGDDGEPTAQDWAEACETISYEIVTQIGGRFARRYVDSAADPEADR